MTKEEFVSNLKTVVVEGSIKAIESNLHKPPGRQPQTALNELSEWYNKLNDSDKKLIKRIITDAVEMSFFSFLSVLDGVSAIESGTKKGNLILNYEKDGKLTWLNDPNDNYLHDLL